MPINTSEIIALVADLSRNADIQVTISQSIRGGFIAGVSTMIGGILLGPAGLAVGGLVGGVTAASTSSSFRPVAEILMNDLTPAQQAMLVNRVNNVIRSINVTDVAQLAALAMTNDGLRNEILAVARDFVRSDLNLQLL